MYLAKTKSYLHQITALTRIENRPNWPAPTDVFCLNMEQGTGKTKVIIDEFGIREDAKDLRNMLVVAPKGVYSNWKSPEIPEHLSDDLQERASVFVWRSSGGVEFRRSVELFLYQQDRPRILLVNVEAIGTVQRAVDLCETFLKQRRTMMVIDESTCIRGLTDKTTRSEIAVKLGKLAVARRIMSGLITPRSPLDLYSQFEFLDYRILGFQSYYAFKARYAIIKRQEIQGKIARYADGRVMINSSGAVIRAGGRLINLVVDYRNVEELRAKIAPYTYRVLKKDCLDLPPKIYLPPRNIELTSEQAKILKSLKETAQAQLSSGSYVSVKNKLSMLIRMHQVLCGHVVDETGGEHVVPSNRMRELLEILNEEEGKVIIWSGFRYCIREVIDTVKKEFGPISVVDFYGSTTDKMRDEAKQRFQHDSTCRYFVGNQASAGLGLTLTAASLVVYYSNTWDLEHRVQSEDRAHRAGLDHHVTYTDLVAVGTMETKLIQCLRKKIDLATLISGDGYKEWII